MRGHEKDLDGLESQASKAAKELDEKNQTIKGAIQDQDAYLVEAQNLLFNKYKSKSTRN